MINSIYLKSNKIKDVFITLNDIYLWLQNGTIVTVDRFDLSTTNSLNYVLPKDRIVDILVLYRVADIDILLCNNNVLLIVTKKKTLVI